MNILLILRSKVKTIRLILTKDRECGRGLIFINISLPHLVSGVNLGYDYAN